jgi:hypothetical protein
VQVVRQLHVLLEQRHDAAHRRFDIAAHVLLLRQQLDDDAVEALVFLPLDGAGTIDSFDEHLDVAVGQFQRLHHVGDASHREDVFGTRVVNRGIVLRGEEYLLVLPERVLERAGRGWPPDDERHHHVREYDDIPQRDNRQCLVNFHLVGIR